ARIARTRISIVDDRRSSGLAASRSIAKLIAVARVAVTTTCSRRNGLIRDTSCRIARVCRAGVAIVDDGRGTGEAAAGCVAKLIAVAGVSIAAARAGAYRRV